MGEPITVTESDIRGMRRDFTRHVMTRPSTVFVLVAFAFAAVVFAVVALAAAPAYGVAAAVAVLVLVLLPWAVGRRVTHAARSAMPVGSWLHGYIEGGVLKTESPTGSASTVLSAFRRTIVLPGAVLVQRTGSNVVGMFPRRCFTDDELAVLRRVDAARGRGVQ